MTLTIFIFKAERERQRQRDTEKKKDLQSNNHTIALLSFFLFLHKLSCDIFPIADSLPVNFVGFKAGTTFTN